MTHLSIANDFTQKRVFHEQKKGMPYNLSFSDCSSSSTFHTRKATQVAIFLEHLMVRLSTKLNKPYTIMMV
jgi:hypothetical protein